jgi:predicted Zn-dependent protease
LTLLTGGKNNQNTDMLKQISSGIVGLKFSRGHEEEADAQSVVYLCATGYNAAGAAGFFRKIQGKGATPPAFLSTHPDPKNRIQDIENKAKAMGCSGSATNMDAYARIKSLL